MIASSNWWTYLDTLRACLSYSLLPTFDLQATRNSKYARYAYLDGLRGFAAVLVYQTHYTGFAHEHVAPLVHAFGWNDQYSFASLPIIRLLFHGGKMTHSLRQRSVSLTDVDIGAFVSAFFVISGYVLSIYPLILIQAECQDRDRIAIQLGRAFPRRWVRLYGPVITTTFIFMTIWHVFDITSAEPGAHARAPDYLSELSRWFSEFLNDSWFFRVGGFANSDYNTHLWSIATEFQGSAVVYVVLLVFSALGYGPSARMASCSALFIYFLYFADAPSYALFLAGIMICDLDLINERDPSQRPGFLKRLDWLTGQYWFPLLLTLLGVYLGTAPQVIDRGKLASEPGWYYIAKTIPPTSTNARKFVGAWGALLAVIGIPRVKCLRRFCETPFCQYLGRISFGLYLIHGPMLWTCGDRLLATFGRPRSAAAQRIPSWVNLFPLSDKGPLGLEINVLVPNLILLPLTIWIAAVVTKLFDEPSIMAARRLFPKATSKKGILISYDNG